MYSDEMQDLLFGKLVRDRQCGGCTACCVALHIDEPGLKKDADVACHHLTASGCGIYDTRPEVCRTWHCLWRRIGVMPDEARPDRTGVMFTFGHGSADPNRPQHAFEMLYVKAVALNSPADFDHPIASQAIEMFVEAGKLPVWLSFNGRQTLAFPDPALADAILNPETTAHRNLKSRANKLRRAWRIGKPE